MRNAIAGPALMVVGGVLVLVTMVLGWITVSLIWQDEIVAEGTLQGPNGVLVASALLILAGFVVASTKSGRRTGFRVIAVIASALVLVLAGVTFVRSYGVESLVLADTEGTSNGASIRDWIAHGASVSADRSIGLFLAFGGGLLGLAGGVLALRKPRSLQPAIPPPPPLPTVAYEQR